MQTTADFYANLGLDHLISFLRTVVWSYDSETQNTDLLQDFSSKVNLYDLRLVESLVKSQNFIVFHLLIRLIHEFFCFFSSPQNGFLFANQKIVKESVKITIYLDQKTPKYFRKKTITNKQSRICETRFVKLSDEQIIAQRCILQVSFSNKSTKKETGKTHLCVH